MFAIVTGGRGQDGQLMISYLKGKKYSTISIIRDPMIVTTAPQGETNFPSSNYERIIDLYDLNSVLFFLKTVAQKAELFQQELGFSNAHAHVEIYHFMCEKQGVQSYDDPLISIESSSKTTLNLLESIRRLKEETACRFSLFFAGSSEMFGDAKKSPQSELTNFLPKSPYAIGKVIAQQTCTFYREVFKVRACTGILFNHESILRSSQYVSRKIIKAVVDYKLCRSREILRLGNLSAQRDWSYAEDVIHGIYLALNYHDIQDFVFAMGEVHTVRDFVSLAFMAVDVCITWKGTGLHEEGINEVTGEKVVTVNPDFFRDTTEMPCLCGDIRKATTLLHWKKQYNFEEMIKKLVLDEIHNFS